LIGASGYVGQEFSDQLTSRGHGWKPLGRSQCDLYSVDAVTHCLEDEAPDAVINCAGYTGKPNVDACETDKVACLAANAVLPGILAEACARVGVPWGHVSSGCIYSGRTPEGSGFTEEDRPNFSFRQDNCSFYSGTKALGEEVLAGAPRCYMWRLRIPFSEVDSSRNYLSKLLRYNCLLEAENSLSLLPEYVTAAIECMERRLPYGIYNLTNPGSVWTSEVVEMLEAFGIAEKAFYFFPSEQAFRRVTVAPRSNCVLDSSKAAAAGLTLSPVREALRNALANWQTTAVETTGT